MTFPKFLIIIVFSILFLSAPNVSTAEDRDWLIQQEAVTKSGPGTPIVGQRWSMGSLKNDLMFNIHLDASPDMLMGNWYGDIRSQERFSSPHLVGKNHGCL